jgi:LPXTG-motif cell wall-anchored protein
VSPSYDINALLNYDLLGNTVAVGNTLQSPVIGRYQPIATISKTDLQAIIANNPGTTTVTPGYTTAANVSDNGVGNHLSVTNYTYNWMGAYSPGGILPSYTGPDGTVYQLAAVSTAYNTSTDYAAKTIQNLWFLDPKDPISSFENLPLQWSTANGQNMNIWFVYMPAPKFPTVPVPPSPEPLALPAASLLPTTALTSPGTFAPLTASPAGTITPTFKTMTGMAIPTPTGVALKPTPPASSPTKDVALTENGDSVDNGSIGLTNNFVYELDSKYFYANRDQTTQWSLTDDYNQADDKYQGTYDIYALTDFGSYKTGDKIATQTDTTYFTAADTNGVLSFTATQAWLDLMNQNLASGIQWTIDAAFERITGNVQVQNTFTESVNNVTQNSNTVTTHTPKPSIDIEKANNSVPSAGNGNYTDTPNNAGPNDHDTSGTADVMQPGQATEIYFRITNNGTEDLKTVTVSDQLTTDDTSGTNVGTITWKDANGQVLTVTNNVLYNADGSGFIFKVGDYVTGSATLPAVPLDSLHGDLVSVTGIGVLSGLPVGDNDKWYGHPKTPKPSIDIEKANSALPNAGNGNNTDTSDNVGTNDHDTPGTLYVENADGSVSIFFRITNNGEEPLTKIVVKDVQIAGNDNVQGIVYTYNGQVLTQNAAGELTVADGSLLVLPVGAYIVGEGTLPSMPANVLEGDQATVTAVGAISGLPVGDTDKWYGERIVPAKPTPAPTPAPAKPVKVVHHHSKHELPETGDGNDVAFFYGGAFALAAAGMMYGIKRKRA